jgi:virginiamycin B lyase
MIGACCALASCSGSGAGLSPAQVGGSTSAGSHSEKPQVIEQGVGAQIITFPDPASANPLEIIRDGTALYFTDGTLGIGKVTTAGVVSRYTAVSTVGAWGLAVGPDNNVWFSGYSSAIAHTTASGSVVEFTVPVPTSLSPSPSPPCVYALASTPADTTGVWFTDICNSAVGRISTDGSTTVEYLPPSATTLGAITAGPDHNLWFVEVSAGKIAKMVPGTRVITEYPLASGIVPSGSVAIANSNGSVWFSYYNQLNQNGGIASISTSGVAQTAQSPNNASATAIAPGPDGNIWYATNSNPAFIDSVTSAGTYVNDINVGPITITSLVTGPDKNIWFTDESNQSIDVYVVNPQTVTPTSIAFNMIGEMQTFSASEGGSGTTLTVTSSNAKVASVAPAATLGQWTVTAVNGGSCTIKVADQNGNYTDISVSVTTETLVVQ